MLVRSLCLLVLDNFQEDSPLTIAELDRAGRRPGNMHLAVRNGTRRSTAARGVRRRPSGATAIVCMYASTLSEAAR